MCSSTQTDIRDVIVNCLSQQLSELELLKAMYPNSDDIIFTDSKILDKIQHFLNNESEFTPSHLDYTLNLYINELKLEVCINLPTMYPEEEPDIYIRCNQLNRQQETQLNTELSSYIKDKHLGDVCLYDAISWIQDNIDNFASSSINNKPDNLEEWHVSEDKYVRLWIYSHHIYNKKKREEIIKKAKELHLTGFCLPGKPGIICIEGSDMGCNEWWKDIKSMSWKKIGLRRIEELESTQDLKFSNFEEIQFKNTVNRYSKHPNMSEFSKYMDTHGLSQVFSDVFRLE